MVSIYFLYCADGNMFALLWNAVSYFDSNADLKVVLRGASRWRKCKTRRSPSSPQIHQKYIYMWNSSYKTPTERWQKTSDLPKGRKLPHVPG